MPLTDALKDSILHHIPGASTTEAPIRFTSIPGGSINDTYRISIVHQPDLFVKINSATSYPGLFTCEADGLGLLKQCGAKTPDIIAGFAGDNWQFLLLKWINPGIKTSGFWKKFGETLASLHHHESEHFGLDHDNYIGALPQYNLPSQNWIDFFTQQRLGPQLEDAGKYLTDRHRSAFRRLFDQLPSLFNDEMPCLLHGDLWNGNFLCDELNEPVLIDPAVYYGHRSMEFAMTTLFGGFDRLFYEAYNYHFPFPDNHEEQWQICQLYPLLVHVNLFGRTYLSDIESILKKYGNF